SGIKYEGYIKKFILDPLNMKRSGFFESKDDEISIPYVMLPDKDKITQPTPATFPFNQFIFAPGGLISSVKEMANDVIMVMNDGNFEEKQLFKPELLNEMQEMHYTGRVHPILSTFGESGYGYGWGITKDFFGYTLITHAGGITGGISYIGFLKEVKLGFVSIGNADGFPSKEILAALALLLGKDPDKELPFIVRENHYNKLCGQYATYGGIVKGSIVNKLGLLYAETKLPPLSMPLIPVDDTDEPLEFYYTNEFGVRMPAKFVIDDDQKVHLTIERNVLHKI
ncbi:MAG: serine hydrolase, partial [Candidatus Hodarchaeota archaeon]